jgi:hypothetical protein
MNGSFMGFGALLVGGAAVTGTAAVIDTMGKVVVDRAPPVHSAAQLTVWVRTETPV